MQTGDEEKLYEADYKLYLSPDGWRIAIKKVAGLESVSTNIQHAFLRVWTERKMLFFLSRVSRRAMLKALRILLPRSECVGPVRLFRGASAREHQRRTYGFSWSAKREVAEGFAHERRVWDGGSVLFETLAPPEAVLHLRQDWKGYYEEAEYIIDPLGLRRVKVIERYAEPK